MQSWAVAVHHHLGGTPLGLGGVASLRMVERRSASMRPGHEDCHDELVTLPAREPSVFASIDVGSTAGDSKAGDALDHDGIQVKDHPEKQNLCSTSRV